MPIRLRGFAEACGGPEAARYDTDHGEFILPYDRVALAASPDETLLEFLQSTYEAAAMLGAWDRAALENDFSISSVGSRRKS